MWKIGVHLKRERERETEFSVVYEIPETGRGWVSELMQTIWRITIRITKSDISKVLCYAKRYFLCCCWNVKCENELSQFENEWQLE